MFLYLCNYIYFFPKQAAAFALKLVPMIGYVYNNVTDPEWYFENRDWFYAYHFTTSMLILNSLILYFI